MSDHAIKNMFVPKLKDIQKANEKLKSFISHTPLLKNANYSEKYQANIYFKREDLQIVRSYKIRGAYNKMNSLAESERAQGVVCASAGNHAQGVAYSCQKLKVKGTIFMPNPTPNQKIRQVKMFGKEFIDIVLTGDTYDSAYETALKYSEKNKKIFIHPFDDEKVIEGQGTIGLEILHDTQQHIDYLLIPIGGGGLAAGLGSLFKTLSPDTKIIGIEPEGAPAMKISIEQDKVVTMKNIDKFVDGAAVQRVGDITFPICKQVLDEIITVPEGRICTTILELYNEEAIVAEPAGALAISALTLLKGKIKNKTVVCIVSGGNNDITRTEEIKERSLLYEGLKHYFIIRFAQRAGALKEFVNDVLGPNDDITLFEYSKKTNRENGPALIGVELKNNKDFQSIIQKLKEKNIIYEYLNQKPDLFQYLI